MFESFVLTLLIINMIDSYDYHLISNLNAIDGIKFIADHWVITFLKIPFISSSGRFCPGNK